MAKHICPWWAGYFLVSPLRKLMQNPRAILTPYVKKGMQVIDIGSGMGYFSLPLAELVGDKGLVHCVDVQPQMLKHLEKRALRKGLRKRLMLHLVSAENLNMQDYRQQLDFALAFAVAHEVPDKQAFFRTIYEVLKKPGLFLFSEPKNHVAEADFADSIAFCKKLGFKVEKEPAIRASLSVLLKKMKP